MAISCHGHIKVAISSGIQCAWQEEEDVDHKDGPSQIKTTLDHTNTPVSYVLGQSNLKCLNLTQIWNLENT